MDTFMDRLSHKKSAQEMIQANTAADAAKMEQMQHQITEYETLLQDIRKVNLKSIENMEQMRNVLQESLKKIESLKEDNDTTQKGREAMLSDVKSRMDEMLPQMKAQIDEMLPQMKAQIGEMLPQMKAQIDEMLPQIKNQTEEAFQRSDDFLHKENVKVYRNVQAAMTEELEKQTKVLMESNKGKKGLMPVSVIILIMVIIDIAINLFNIVIKL